MSVIWSHGSGQVSTALAKDRLGVVAVVFFVMSASAPLTVIAGVVPTGLAVTGLLSISVAFLAVAVVLAVFSVGYVAMARHIANTGAFYAFVSGGIGRPVGVGASWVALVAYSMFECAGYGGFGAIAAPLFTEWLGLHVQWWVLALIGWAVVAVLGVRDIAVSGRVLATLLAAETLLVVVFGVADIFVAGFHASSAPLNVRGLVGPGAGALLVMAVAGFVGFEQSVVYTEESRDPRRTVPRATYLAIALIAVLYAFASWAMISAAGSTVLARAAAEGPDLFFDVASARVGSVALLLGHVLFLTSLLAAMISFHNISARYTFSLGREGVLPRRFGRTVPGTGAPRNGSLAQSTLGLIVIVLYAVAGWDPLIQLFYWGGTGGSMGVLLLIALTSIAIIGYFARNPTGEDAWHRLGAPIIATVLLVITSYLALTNIATLFGVAPGSKPTWVVPLAFGVVALAGAVWALVLRRLRPQLYADIGLGANGASNPGAARSAGSGIIVTKLPW
ncbi:APC family permease [Pseudonocardia alaniniphila]|uniref:APC family permease n=1 Tax=Pseudonocardia alaniniphila TaxID=75291 RepID=A0ABS9T6R4_9PSEU|nr:APC family permease [Pseudonocardia alaniniphila]MCH6164227.1 APC family permease [Pseudonocardia alaniniphila]